MTHNLKGGTIYVTQYPCNVCAQAIIQVGIKRVVYLTKKETTDTHIKRNRSVENMLNDCNVRLDYFYDLHIDDFEFLEKLKDLNEKYYLKD